MGRLELGIQGIESTLLIAEQLRVDQFVLAAHIESWVFCINPTGIHTCADAILTLAKQTSLHKLPSEVVRR